MSFEVGDKVYSLLHGWRKVINPGVFGDSLRVDFEMHGIFHYDKNGHYQCSPEQVLFHGIPEIIAPPEPDRRPKFEVDAPIMVRDEDGEWIPRHFVRWDGEEGVYVWMAGRTSHSAISKEDIIWFKYWKEVDK